jgi:hypothetical protein
VQLYVDMDGVLADFDQHYEDLFGVRPDKETDVVDWSLVRSTEDFYLNIPTMRDLPILWAYIKKYDPIVLTGIPQSVEEASDNKKAWVQRNLGDVEVICCPSRNKAFYAEPGDILIDDWEKYMDLWLNKGGIWVTHLNAIATINQLKVLGL